MKVEVLGNSVMTGIMDIHVLKLVFGSLTVGILVFGSLLNIIENQLPIFVVQSFRYGKFAYKGGSSHVAPIEVPKRWFRHFYLFAMLFSMGCLLIALNVYSLSGSSDVLMPMLNFLATSRRSYSVSSMATFLALLLMTMHCTRRFYETWFISVFSSTKMNLFFYFLGYIHYSGVIFAVLAEAPGFTPHIGVSYLVLRLQPSELHLYHLVAILSFMGAFCLQYSSAIRLAELRKDSTGNVVSKEHRIPSGGMFELVSSPHMFCEIVLYFSLMVLLWGNSVMPWIAAWVFCNQVESALLTHWWYQSTFKEYPKQRKAIFPYVL